MSKVICDVCGTTYPETASQCPICGCAKSSGDQTAAGAAKASSEASAGYTYVKGGRFSKKNVRKRNQKGKTPERRSTGSRPKQEEEEKSNAGLIIIVVLLLLAIIAVLVYIGVSFFGPGSPDSTQPSGNGTHQTTPGSNDDTDPTGDPGTDATVPCESLQLSNKTIQMIAAGDTWTLEVRPAPAETTDVIMFTSSDENVATVSQEGVITAVGPGEATITVTCGAVTEECQIMCSFGSGEDPTDPTDPVDPEFVFEFNTSFKDETSGKYDITFDKKGTWRAYPSDMSVDPAAINWISDDPSICTVENGIVTLVGPGTTEIHAEYDGKTYTCIVRCVFEADSEDPGENTGAYVINKTDVTIAVGETFTLTLKDSDGNVIDVEWVAENDSYVSISGNKITGAAAGVTDVSVTYEGETYTCIVRVS